MSEPQETLFELETPNKIEVIGIPVDATLDQIKIYVNGVDINRTLKIANLKIVKVL